jgi:hypothetical protein
MSATIAAPARCEHFRIETATLPYFAGSRFAMAPDYRCHLCEAAIPPLTLEAPTVAYGPDGFPVTRQACTTRRYETSCKHACATARSPSTDLRGRMENLRRWRDQAQAIRADSVSLREWAQRVCRTAIAMRERTLEAQKRCLAPAEILRAAGAVSFA